MSEDMPGLTDKEKECLAHLKDAWNIFVNLDHCTRSIDSLPGLQEFIQGIHACQHVIALRVARRVDPDVWC